MVLRRIDLLHRVLVREYKRGNNVVLIIDEAQNVPPETLESIRLLTNIETDSEKLIQIILCGQPELKRLLAMQSLRQLRERIAVKTELRALTKAEAIEYIHHRLQRARQPQDGSGIGKLGRDNSRTGDSIFTDDAINEVIRRTGGNPRAINILCDNALITGYGYQKYPIASPIIREIAKELDDGLPPKAGFADGDRSGWARVAGYGLAAVALIAFLAIGGLMLFKALFDRVDSQPVAAQTEMQKPSESDSSSSEDPVASSVQTTNVETSRDTDRSTGSSVTAMIKPALQNTDNSANGESTDANNAEVATTEQDTSAGAPSSAPSDSTPSNSSGVVTFDASQSNSVNTGQNSEAATAANTAESAPQAAVSDTAGAVTSLSQKVTDVTAQIKPASTSDVPNQAAGSIPGADQTRVVSPQNPAKVSSSVSPAISSSAQNDLATDSGASTSSPTPEPVVVAENASTAANIVSDSTNTGGYFAVRTVRPGDMLWNMVLDVYGVASPQIMEWLLDQNPQVSNRDVINVGEDINFPNLPDRFLP